MIISRDLINKNIKFHDVTLVRGSLETVTNNYNDLSTLIDGVKNLFQGHNSKPGDKIVIGPCSILWQVAFVIAAAELGLDIVVPRDETDASLLAPLKFLCAKRFSQHGKLSSIGTMCEHSILANADQLDLTPNTEVRATPGTTFLSCVTGDRQKGEKIVKHSHDFIASLSKRNSPLYSGKTATLTNINHGSSPAAYFIPLLLSEKVTDIYHLQDSEIITAMRDRDNLTFEKMFGSLIENNINIEHICVPYPQYIDIFINSGLHAQQCTFYTFSYIKNEYVEAVRNNVIKDVVSLYGSSETSGPVLWAKISDLDFQENKFKKIDDFYGLVISEQGLLEITLPIYNYTVTTPDNFEIQNDSFVLAAKSTPRINDMYAALEKYYEILDAQKVDAKIVLDGLKNSIYLAIFSDHSGTDIVTNLDKEMRTISEGRHSISKFDFLDRQNFSTAKDLNKVLIDYFRNKPYDSN